MPTNLTQQIGWEFSETPYKTVATSDYKFGTVACNILQMKHNTHYGFLGEVLSRQPQINDRKWVGG